MRAEQDRIDHFYSKKLYGELKVNRPEIQRYAYSCPLHLPPICTKQINNRIVSIEIRKIDKGEYELVADMFNKYRIFYKQPSDMQLAKEYLKERLENNEAQIFIAFRKGSSELLGFTLLYARFSSVSAIKNWHIGDLYVEPNQRKQGIGQELLQTAIDFANEHKAKFVSLNTAKDNFTAQKVYEDFGFDKRDYLPEYQYYQFDLWYMVGLRLDSSSFWSGGG